MTVAQISRVHARDRVAVSRTYHRVAGANVLVYEPARRAPGAEDLMVVSMHGGLNPSLESAFLESVASYGVRTAFCVPDKSSFIDQFRSMDACMALFRELTGTIVLMGQSRGAALMSGYQKIAENGSHVFQGPERRLPIPDLHLRPADGLMLLDANFGTTVMHVMSLNPALVAEGNAVRIDPTLDATNPANGYAPDGGCSFDEEFKSRFLSAQRARYLALLDAAQERLDAIARGDGDYADNEPFIVPDGIGINDSPKLFAGDLRLLSHTRKPWPLIHRDGSITTGIVPCVRTDENNPGFAGKLAAAFVSTVRDYLWSEVTVREDYDYGEDFLSGIDFESSFTCSSGNVAMISCPLLLMGHTGGYEYIAAEWSHDRAASEDTTIAFLEGATHGWTPVDAQIYGDTLGLEARYVVQWVTAPGRFAPAEEDAAERSGSAEPDASPGDIVALRARLVGEWVGATTSQRARFSLGGGSELGFAEALTRFEIMPDGSLRLHDRYGDTVSARLTSDPLRAAVEPGAYYLDDDTLVLQTVALHRAGDDAEVREPHG